MTSPEEEQVEVEAASELHDWYQSFIHRTPRAVLSGMLVSAAAELMTGLWSMNRETFVEIAGRAWDRWSERRESERPSEKPS